MTFVFSHSHQAVIPAKAGMTVYFFDLEFGV
jgi:hypothetical protein